MPTEDLEYQPPVLSPKVYGPLVVGLIGFVITGITAGFWDTENLTVLVTTAALTLFGVAAPPAPGVKQSEVVALARAKDKTFPAAGKN